MAMTDAVTIGVVDNDDMALRALRAIIGSLDAGFSVVWAVTSPSSAARRCMVPRTRPDVVVIDMAMNEMPGYELCGKIRGLCPGVGIVGITSYPLDHYRRRAAYHGAHALVAKHDVAALAAAITGAAAHGRNSIRESDEPAAAAAITGTDGPAALSSQELRIMQAYAQGSRTSDIMAMFGITKSTVASYEHRACAKLGARTRAHAIAICIREHLF
ncbi:response regulator [Bifidobacterium phasiani]|uniref:Response regulator transcription factor n=1 Tax=Bifidobacterium phasiani TaxID=2834431 RepID=A0ABS6W6Z8_9BIFI|nr:response regulator [Bifidobacterium phasiani]MBW3082264.1 response regulator transcription factor [Bifidobacterium phasiani]